MPKDDLESRFARSLTRGDLLETAGPVALAVSGGIDSVVMLHLFCGLAAGEGAGVTPRVIHVNHQLRGDESQGDADFVSELAASLGVPCTIESVDVAARAEADGISIESAGRRCRLECYHRFCLIGGIKAVALAHHADDNAETILHRVVRGTGLRGLAGIRRVRPFREGSDIRIIRPLLGFRRAEIEEYGREHGVTHRQDPSNDSDKYTRNRVRHEVLPLLRERLNPQVSEALIRLGEQARAIDAYLSETGERMLESLIVEHDDHHLVLHGPSLTRKPRVIQTQLIRQALLRMGVAEGELTYGHFNAVTDLAAGSEGSKALDLPAGLRVSRRYSRLVFERTASISGEMRPTAEVPVAMQGTTLLPARGVQITASVIPGDPALIAEYLRRRVSGGKLADEEWLDADQVCPPLIGRSRRPGDRFFPLGMTGLKKLSDFFIDEKIDPRTRDRTVVLCDQLGPIWIVPIRIDQRVRLTRATQHILRLEAEPIGQMRP